MLKGVLLFFGLGTALFAGEPEADIRAALRELGCDTTLVETSHPVVDVIRFQLLTLDVAERRGVEPDRIRRDDPRWAAAAAAAKTS